MSKLDALLLIPSIGDTDVIFEAYIVEIDTDNGIQDYYRLLECTSFDIVNFGDGITVYVDDEGLMKTGNPVSDIKCNVTGDRLTLAGRILFLGSTDDEGETLSLSSEQKDYLETSTCLSPRGVVK